MGTGKQYDEDFKEQAIKLAREVGNTAASDELGIPKGTLGTRMHKARLGEMLCLSQSVTHLFLQ